MNNQLVTNFLRKTNLFNYFLSQQCNTIDSHNALFCSIHFETTSRISSFDIYNDEITIIMQSLYPNKTHGYDNLFSPNKIMHFFNVKVFVPYLLNTVWKKNDYLTNKKRQI